MLKTSAAVLACGAVVATLAAAPASAVQDEPVSKVTLRDTTHDIWVIGPGEDEWDFFGSKPTVDIKKAVARHGADAVTTTFRLVDLRRGARPQEFIVKVKLPDGFRRASVFFGPDDRTGTHGLINVHSAEVACPGFEHDVDYGDDRVRLRIPRSCLKDPSWVRVKMQDTLWREWTTLGDSAHGFPPKPTYTRRLHHPEG